MAGFNINLIEVCAFTKVLIDFFHETINRYFNKYHQPHADHKPNQCASKHKAGETLGEAKLSC